MDDATSQGSSATDIFGSLLQAASKFATPFAEKLAYGDQTASELALARERAKYSSLNGSGPNNNRSSIMNASGLRDFLFGAPDETAVGGAAPSTGFLYPALIVLVLGGLLLWFVRR